MINAMTEFIEETKNKEVLCACIVYEKTYDNETKIVLPVDYSIKEYEHFLSLLNFEYDEGYGSQKLFGFIWYKDGTWSDRGEYDGSEWWSYQKIPKIPEECKV
jgi:hypothetical protein